MDDADDFEQDEGAVDEGESRCFSVSAAEHGMRLDRVLAQRMAEFSRSWLKQLMLDGAAQVNGQVVTRPAHKVQVGDAVCMTLRPTPQARAFRPQAMALDILHEDDDLLVINKPAGLVVHPAPGHWGGTLLNGLLARDARAAGLERAGIVHRLDKDTSGALVVARSALALERLRAAFAARQVTRQYLALVHGPWSGPVTQDVDAAIGRDPYRRTRMAVLDPGRYAAKPARTTVGLLQTQADVSLVQCQLHSGRTHQIRVHLTHLGHPLLADALYGGRPALGLTRQALHARRLALVHPRSGVLLDCTAPLPVDLQMALDAGGFTMGPLAAH